MTGDATGAPHARRRSGEHREVHWAAQFLDALRAGSAPRARSVVEDALREGAEPAAVHSRVIAPAMHEVGELWQRGLITVADEHLATAISDAVLAALFPRLLTTPLRSRERVLLAAAEGEHHVLGLRMVADTLEGAGFEVLYLGANVPADALLAACRRHRPAVVGLSVSMPLNVPILIWALEQLDALGKRPVVIVGGRAIAPAIERGLRVTPIARSEDVVGVVERLLEHPPTGALVPEHLRRPTPRAPAGAPDAGETIGTRAHAFSAATLATAEATREVARHGFGMQQLAYRDPLTGLGNRRALDDRLRELSREAPGELTVLMLDIDGFKDINDRRGHDAGDRVLVGVARVITHSIRPRDFAARVGGDEFVVLLPRTPTADGVAIGERIRGTVERELGDPVVTVSVGVGRGRDSVHGTVRAGDRALYEAKQAGRNRVALLEG